jgi:hypothetical protein
MTTNDSDQQKTNSTDEDDVFRVGTKEDIRSAKSKPETPVSPDNDPPRVGTKEDIRGAGSTGGGARENQPDTLRDGAKKPT